jgi:hypothetical protein
MLVDDIERPTIELRDVSIVGWGPGKFMTWHSAGVQVSEEQAAQLEAEGWTVKRTPALFDGGPWVRVSSQFTGDPEEKYDITLWGYDWEVEVGPKSTFPKRGRKAHFAAMKQHNPTT